MSESRTSSFGQRLRQHRQMLSWSQRRLAEAIGATEMSINRWEHGKAVPQLYYREQLCQIFNINAADLFDIDTAERANTGGSDFSRIWNVPFPRNLYFTGREEVLSQLAETLSTQRRDSAAIQIISGLGGIGKTQVVIEYAYRHRDNYQSILWLHAESQEGLTSNLVALAGFLHLPEQHEQNQQVQIEAVKRWLNEYDGWLLIIDNVEDMSLVENMLPFGSMGHILLTTRSQATGTVGPGIYLKRMTREEGALFLLWRAKRLARKSKFEEVDATLQMHALTLVDLVDGLPLALDQVGGYIEETGCDFADYLTLYQRHHAALLSRRGVTASGHPLPVLMTFSLALDQVKGASPVALALLQLCAFLPPDAIPQELLTEEVCLEPEMCDALVLDQAISLLRRFSLLVRHPEAKMVSIHRLVQVALFEGMDEATQRQRSEHIVRLVNRLFPDPEDLEAWPRCQRYLLSALNCLSLIERWMLTFPEARQLLIKMVGYLVVTMDLAQAEMVLAQATKIITPTADKQDVDYIDYLLVSGVLLSAQGQYAPAEMRYQQALEICQQTHRMETQQGALILNNLGARAFQRGHSTEALALHCQALGIRERLFGPDHPEVAISLSHLGAVALAQGNADQAEIYYQQALGINEKRLGLEHPRIAPNLHWLGILYGSRGDYLQAESYFQRARAIDEKVWGSEHVHTTISYNNLAKLYVRQEKFAQAELLYLQALVIRERVLGTEHADVAILLQNLADLFITQERYGEAKSLYQRIISIRRKTWGADHPKVTQVLEDYATLCSKIHRELEAGSEEP